MTRAAPVLVLDVNETMSDLRPLGPVLAGLGVPEVVADEVARGWFAAVLRDAFALSLAGRRPAFADVVRGAAHAELSRWRLDRPLEEAADALVQGVRSLPLHADVAPGLRSLAERGVRVVTLSNGPAQTAATLLEDAGVRDTVEQVLSVDDAPAWKPARAAYEHAAGRCGMPLEQLVLAACHPWDVDGARRAGLRALWVDRDDRQYPGSFLPPDATVTSFAGLPDALAALG